MLSLHSARARWMTGAFLLLALALTEGIYFRATTAADKEDQSLSAFMRKKLDASSKILEGITTEDSQLVVQGADALLAMSKTEIWNVLLDQDYRDFNTEFRGSVRKLRDAAEKGNFDNATLQWMDAVKSCVECHKYVRSQRPVVK
ncbi:hypothetical protein Spb1_17770 [Planctopirus ephydatiae]|uniref:Cytochrome C n=1 Tax=Planctopirus ephydatiae TaxID=2528019 RepID=A0A518GML2_9PLAN|nr:cytochrome c [Planctopirus ephydatiae]QDV29858.1 hypothetical protein Spb1_17770 [Planctopirus ephydatiae]